MNLKETDLKLWTCHSLQNMLLGPVDFSENYSENKFDCTSFLDKEAFSRICVIYENSQEA